MSLRPKRATQVDVARHAGVSQATVSMVLSGGSAAAAVAEKTREHVTQAAEELGYAVNIAARSLRGGRNRILGLFTFEPVFPIEQRDFYYPFLVGVERGAADNGQEVLLFTSAGVSGARRIYRSGENRLKVADGCVLLGRDLDQSDLERLVREDFPFVFIGQRDVEGAELSYVAADYHSATRVATERVIRAGHRRVIYLREPGDRRPTLEREHGAREAWRDAGLGEGLEFRSRSGDGAVVTARDVRAWRESGVTALLIEPTAEREVEADLEAAAVEAGLRIPADLSAVILGDSPGTTHARPWSRFSLPRSQMGQVAVELLLRAHRGEGRAS